MSGTGASAPPALLASKLRPERGSPAIVARPALLGRLRAAHRTPVIVVEAPPGYGKTTLIAEWTRHDPRPLGWYAIEGADNDPAVFFTYLAAALVEAGVDLGDFAQRLWRPPRTTTSAVARLCGAVASLSEPALLVLDDVEQLEEPVCLAAVRTLAAAIPSGSQLVLLTRKPLGFLADAKTGQRGEVFRLGMNDLRLSDAEAEALLASAGAGLESEDVGRLNLRCEGWPASLALIAAAGRDAAQRMASGQAGVDRFVAEFLREELLDGLREDARTFLAEVSVLQSLSAPLCDAVRGRTDSERILEGLSSSDLLLWRVPNCDGAFSLHPLLREVLQTELAKRAPARRLELLHRAADWYEASGDLEEAAETTIAAGDLDRAAALMPLLSLGAYGSGRVDTLERWFRELDEPSLLERHPATATLGAGLLLLAGQDQMADRWARTALAGDPAAAMPDGSAAAAWMALLRALLCSDGVEEMAADAEAAAAGLVAGSALGPTARLLLGYARRLGGDEARAQTALRAAVSLAVSQESNVGESEALALLSLMASERGDVSEAETLVGNARTIVVACGLEDYPTSGIVDAASARAALLRGYRPAARAALAHADQLLPQLTHGLPYTAVTTRLELARAHLVLGNPARARTLLDEIERISGVRPNLGNAYEHAAALRQELDRGRSASHEWVSLLTPAELRLLPLLASYLSFPQIAAQLEISRNTVKTQAISVYRKLDVSSRSAAVERARGLGLLGGTLPGRD